MDIKATVNGDTLELVALNADADTFDDSDDIEHGAMAREAEADEEARSELAEYNAFVEDVITTDAAGYTVVNGRRIVRPCRRCGIREGFYLTGSKGNKAAGTKRRAPKRSFAGMFCKGCCEDRIVELNAGVPAPRTFHSSK